MKTIIVIIGVVVIAFCQPGRESSYDYTGSTPAAAVVRSFLGISMTDSIDFIRWHLTLRDTRYQLSCNYGIGKRNTNGFINGGRKINLTGTVKKEQNKFRLKNKDNVLSIAQLNGDLLHLLDAGNNLLPGNSGWSYTLNSTRPAITDEINVTARSTTFKDSIAFEGRTPCNVPGIIRNGIECYKLKWRIVLRNDGVNNNTGRYKVIGTPWRIEGGKAGNWEISTGKNERITYHLKDENGNSFLDLLKLDENIVVFTDKQGKLLVGNEDFSYTLNRVH
jgi:hypothetical protein